MERNLHPRSEKLAGFSVLNELIKAAITNRIQTSLRLFGQIYSITKE
jgi:hypothetical protein